MEGALRARRMKAARRYRARLLADQGAAARSAEFFRSEEHYRAEGVSHSLLVEGEGGSMALALVVREVRGGGADAASPYGYPGGELRGLHEVAASEVDWSEVPLVSIFVRERLRQHCFAKGTPRARTQLVDPALPLRLRRTARKEVARNLRNGMTTESWATREAPAAARAELVDLYRQTMERDRAGYRYRFTDDWFARVWQSPRAHLLITRAGGGAAVCGSLAVESDGFLHDYLTGTADDALSRSPAKNNMAAAIEFAFERGLIFNLGGGMVPGDGIEAFKRGFANDQLSFLTQEIVCDPAAYARLCAGRPAGSFFPAYRASPDETRSLK
jgi:hypothetical protein